jgi:hypothetical protein
MQNKNKINHRIVIPHKEDILIARANLRSAVKTLKLKLRHEALWSS